jgi:hypothetical protein
MLHLNCANVELSCSLVNYLILIIVVLVNVAFITYKIKRGPLGISIIISFPLPILLSFPGLDFFSSCQRCIGTHNPAEPSPSVGSVDRVAARCGLGIENRLFLTSGILS